MTSMYSAFSRTEKDKLERTIAMVQSLGNTFLRYGSPFHLDPCAACGAPVWQQPCPVCRYYPDVSYPRRNAEDIARTEKCTRERFQQLVARHGNIAAWYVDDFRNTVAHAEDALFRKKIEAAYALAKTMDVMDADEIWDESHRRHMAKRAAA